MSKGQKKIQPGSGVFLPRLRPPTSSGKARLSKSKYRCNLLIYNGIILYGRKSDRNISALRFRVSTKLCTLCTVLKCQLAQLNYFLKSDGFGNMLPQTLKKERF